MTAETARCLLALTLTGLLNGVWVANGEEKVHPPTRHFECRDWETQPTVLLAALVLRGDSSYQATDKVDDLTASRPSATGKYTYDESKQSINWTSGGWKGRSGTYLPNVKGTDFVIVHAKQDPEGKVSGALRCARSSPTR